MAIRQLFLRPRDPFSFYSHAVGAVLSIFGTTYLLALAQGKILPTLAALIYGSGLIFVFGASATYHGLTTSSPWPRKLDHLAIYVMIAGTYTPLCLLGLPASIGMPMLVTQWFLAVVGIYLNITRTSVPGRIRVLLYSGMGWMAILFPRVLQRSLVPAQVSLLIVGGLLYTLGTIIYATNQPKLWPGKFGAHDLWHVFVLFAGIVHFKFISGILGL